MTKNLIILILILITGLIIRGTVVYHICSPGVSFPTTDEMHYRMLAENVLNHHTYAAWSEGFFSRSTRAPMYPLFIAASYLLTGSHGMCGPKLINFLSDILSILLLYLIGRKLYSKTTGLAVAAVYALCGHAVYYMETSNPHTFATMILLAVCLSMIYLKENYPLFILPFTLLYALLLHTRPVFLVALPFLIPALYLQFSAGNTGSSIISDIKLNWKKRLAKTCSAVVLILLFCLPWGIRNYRIHGIAVPVCTIAGWHIASNINFDIKLSIKYLTEHFYTPEHKKFTEGDFFRMSRDIFFKSVIEHPVKIPAFGFARLIYCWTPPFRPPYRFLLPRAYLIPIYFTDKFFLPLPDFEGFIYITFFALAAALLLFKRKTSELLKYVFAPASGPAVLVLGYALVHIIGIPLISYRFLIEPVIMLFFTAFIIRVITVLKNRKKQKQNTEDSLQEELKTPESPAEFRRTAAFIMALTFLLLLLPALPLLHSPYRPSFIYPAIHPETGYTYSALHDIQWRNKGNIPENAEITAQGMLKFVHTGFKFITTDYYAAKNADSAAGRLYINYASPDAPFGTGDARVNFPPDMPLPPDGTHVIIHGTAETGVFKEIIINATELTTLHKL